MSSKVVAHAVLACFLALPTLARAQEEQERLLSFADLTNARALALGGAFRALGGTAEVIVGNPAAVTLFPLYRVEVGGAWDFGSKDAFGSVMVLDGQARPIAGGIAYQIVSTGKGAARRTGHLSTLALSYALGPNFNLGTSTRYLVMSGAAAANAVTADVGVMARVGEGVHLGVGGHNLIDTRNPELARYFTGSAALLLGGFNLAGDLKADFAGPETALGFSVGGEYVLGQIFPIRVGYRQDARDGLQAISGGLGFFSGSGGIDLAYQHALNGEGRNIVATLTINVH